VWRAFPAGCRFGVAPDLGQAIILVAGVLALS
jgi:hypothetical protein